MYGQEPGSEPVPPAPEQAEGAYLPGMLRRALDAIHEGIYILDAEGRFVYANPAYTRILGVPVQRVLGRRLVDLEPEVRVLQIFETKRPILGEYLYLKSVDKHLVADQTPIIDENGTFLGVISAFRNITEVVQLQQELRKAEGLVMHLKEELRRKGDLPVSFQSIIGENQELQAALEVAYRAAKIDATVLITGESGVGKELVARAIHDHSPRRQKNLITVNCAALPESLLESELFGYAEGAFTGARRGGKPGKFELADGGTLFLDEVAELPLAMQAKLLRAIEAKEVQRVGGAAVTAVNIRIIAATNADLKARVQDHSFRLDLFHRLNVIPIHIPSLRERPEDIPAMARFFVQRHASAQGRILQLSKEALKLLTDYHWPGNVRELQNAAQYGVLMAVGSIITADELPPAIRDGAADAGPAVTGSIRARVADVERQAMVEALRASQGNRSEAMRRLRMSRAAFYKKLREYELGP